MKNAFSLIEILVVIAIIGILTTVLLPNYIESRQRAGDITRKSDIKQLQTALELYKQSQNPQVYPITIPDPCTAWTSNGVTYMNKVPKDPASLCPAATAKKYYYSTNGDTATYSISACLDNVADLDAVTCPANFFVITGYLCTSPKKCYTVIQP